MSAWLDGMAARPEVRRVIWYGSFVTGTPTPRSDVDLCVVVDHVPVQGEAGDADRGRHTRGARYLPAAATPVPFDVAVLTAREHETLSAWAPAWADAIGRGRVLLAR